MSNYPDGCGSLPGENFKLDSELADVEEAQVAYRDALVMCVLGLRRSFNWLDKESIEQIASAIEDVLEDAVSEQIYRLRSAGEWENVTGDGHDDFIDSMVKLLRHRTTPTNPETLKRAGLL